MMSLAEDEASLQARYDAKLRKKLSLDMTRGKPGASQLALSHPMMGLLDADHYLSQHGIDTRNYGGLSGLFEMKEIFSEFLGSAPEEVMIGGNSSLKLMFECLFQAHVFGVPGSQAPWSKDEERRWLCPVPGYDRHFAMTEYLGYEPLSLPLGEAGLDMDQVEELVKDKRVKGMWLVPQYSNPTGLTLSDEAVFRLAKMKTGAADFRIFWDHAYAVHHLYPASSKQDQVYPLLKACQEAGNPDRAFMFASTSKMTFPGSGVSAFAASQQNLLWRRKHLELGTIGYDKMNQLRHALFFKDMDGVKAHMEAMAELLRPKFEVVLAGLEKELGGLSLAKWNAPRGGYFISLYTKPHQAKRVVELAASAGVKLTKAGATYPHGFDPEDRHIRIAPSYPNLSELEEATEVLALAIKLAALESR